MGWGLDDEDGGAVFKKREAVAPELVGPHDLTLVGDEHTGNARLSGIAKRVEVCVLKDRPHNMLAG